MDLIFFTLKMDHKEENVVKQWIKKLSSTIIEG